MLFTVSNDKEYYVDLTKTLLQSLAENSPSDEIRVYLINCPQEIVERMSRINPAAQIIDTQLDLPDDPDEAKAIIAHYRTVAMRKCLEEENIDKLGWLDSDILVRSSLHEFWEATKPNTLQIMFRKENPDRGKFQVGVFSIGKSQNIIEMIEDWDMNTRNDNTYWYSEQKQLYFSYLRFKDRINFVNLGKEYNDHYAGFRSVIWHCKERHFPKKGWQREYQGYLRRANDKYNQ